VLVAGTIYTSDSPATVWKQHVVEDFNSIIYAGAFCPDTKVFVLVGQYMGIVTSTDLGVTCEPALCFAVPDAC
jgi:hypothetical protein